MKSSAKSDRVIPLGQGLAAIPERLLLAHARGEVLFIAGAGISRPILPDFCELVLDVYKVLDPAVYTVIAEVPPDAHNKWDANLSGLTEGQSAEVKRFVNHAKC